MEYLPLWLHSRTPGVSDIGAKLHGFDVARPNCARSIDSERGFSNPAFAWEEEGSLAVQSLVALKTDVAGARTAPAGGAPGTCCRSTAFRRVWIAVALSAISLVAVPVAAQDECFIDADGWDDVQRFRRCLSEVELDWWGAPSGNTILHRAAASTNNPTVVQLLLEAGADPNVRNDEGLTALHQGATNSNPVVISNLLSAGADPNAMDNDGYTALHYAAARSGNARAVTRLLGAGADPLVESNDGRTPLHSALRYAAEQGVVSELVEAGAAGNLTRLQLAAIHGDLEAVASLLTEGADANEADAYGWSPLHFAVPLAGPEVVSTLLEASADPNARTVGGASVLHLAATQAALTVVAALLEAGADPNVRDGALEAARTPLHLAALSGDDPSVVVALVAAGADPSIRDANGQRPVDFARENDAITGSDAYRRLLVYQPSALVAGRSTMGELESTDGVRWGGQYYDEWTYSAMAGQRVTVTMESREVIGRLLVLHDDGTLLAIDEGWAPNDDEEYHTEVTFQAATTGRYTILATSIFGSVGPYAIQVERPAGREVESAQAGSSMASQPRTSVPEGTLVLDRTFSGRLSSSDPVWDDDDGYYDRWMFSARAGQRLVVTMESGPVDTYLRILGRHGDILESDDDSGSETNSRIEFEAPYTGQYIVIATSYSSGETGSYRIRVGGR